MNSRIVLTTGDTPTKQIFSVAADRRSGIPGHVKLVEEFIRYPQKRNGVVFMRKDETAKWALLAPEVPHET